MNKNMVSIIVILVFLAGVTFYLYIPNNEAPIKVGILHSMTGTMAISEAAVVDATINGD